MGRCSANLPDMIQHGLSAVQKWREVIGRQRSSGLSVAAFSRRYGIPASSFYAWKRKLGRASTAPVFIEAKVVNGLPTKQLAGMIEVRLCGGRRVRVKREGFDRDLFAEVVAVLEGLGRGRRDGGLS
jgi:hypothetical protein